MQTDPARGASPWARGVAQGSQVLLCPDCQSDDPTWAEKLDRCPRCNGTRLGVVLGSVVCRSCGHDWPAGPPADSIAPPRA